jgi:hypothetical protein
VRRRASGFWKKVREMALAAKAPENDCIHWGENRYPFTDRGCLLGMSFCDPKRCEFYEPMKEYIRWARRYHVGRIQVKFLRGYWTGEP